MNNCEECGWPEPCDCEPERSAGSLERAGSAHVGLWIQTKNGNVAHIVTDPTLNQATVEALAEMIDAAAKAAADGKLFKAQNNQAQRPPQ